MTLISHLTSQAVMDAAARMAQSQGRGVLSRAAKWCGKNVLNYFETALASPDRSRIYSVISDARNDIDSFSRQESLRIARSFEENAWATRFGEVFCQYTVGSAGLTFTPASSDDDWNARWKEAWATWCKFCDISSRQDFASFQSLVAWRWFFDGEVFILKTHGGPPEKRPRIQLIESQRVATPPSHWQHEGTTMFDGIEVDAKGRPLRYWVRDGFTDESFRPYDAEDVIHVFEPTRGGQLRGVTLLLSALVELWDLKDLEILENRAAKKQAELVDVYKMRNRELPSVTTMRKQMVNGTGQLSNGTETEEVRMRHIEKVTGAKSIAIGTDEDVIRPQITRPSESVRAYWDYKLSKACAGANIPKLLVVPYSLQGTVTRADLEVADSGFRSRSRVLQAAFLRVYEFVLSETRWTDRKLADPPGDYLKVSIRPPRSIKVDVGYDSAAAIKEYDYGMRTLEGICAERSEDYRDVIAQKAREARLILDTANKEGIDPSMISTGIVDRPERIATEPREPVPAGTTDFTQ